jgi:hypothetical protein
MQQIDRPYFPIIYVRGYAGNDSEIDDTVAEPYMGFNLGSTKFRQLWDGSVRRHYFESPLFRLVKDHGYTDVYSGGQEMPIHLDVGPKSIFIYRYYDQQFFDDLIGRGGELNGVSGAVKKIEEFAEGLGKLIERIRDRICAQDEEACNSFRVYLVGHSMGGLVVRCFLQNPEISTDATKKLVDKVFTYATPHNGIDFRVIGNVPGFFTRNDADNFNRERMAQYLGLIGQEDDVSNLKGRFDPERFFCLVGTNWQDYAAAAGWSRRLTGPMSDGLVRIVNATVFSDKGDGVKLQGPRAFVHRSHSGHYGIVNSEEGYQNLVRFLFGDVRVDGVLELEEITLPREVQRALEEEKTIKASYHFEVVVRVRGFDWELHRRTVREESAIFRTFDEMFPKDPTQRRRHPHLFSVFLSAKAKVNKVRRSLGFAIDLAVLVPEYTIDGFLWRDQHYAGSHLFRDTVTIEATPKTDDAGKPTFLVKYGLDSKTPNRATKSADFLETDGVYVYEIPVASGTKPGLTGRLVLTARPWN